jgi:dsDNA-specific endonuclease/ATPase MutS2
MKEKIILLFINGYPFLVSRICQIIDEKINKDDKQSWNKTKVRQAVKIINEEVNNKFYKRKWRT